MAASRANTAGRGSRRIDERVVLALLAAVVGLCAGGAAVLLSRLLHLASELSSIDTESGWHVVVLPSLGAAAAVALARYLFRDHQGHGVPEVIYSVSRRGGLMRRRTILSRLLGCVLTLGSGGSAGPEAPVVAIGGATGSALGQWFRVKERWRTVLVCCGAGAAIAAIFNAPATGIVFVFEAILEQWAPLSMVPVAIASVVGTEVSRFFSGNQIPFRGANLSAGWMDLAACVGLALFCALVAVALMRALRLVSRVGKRLGLNPVALAAAGGLLVGAIGYFRPEALGEGYQVVRDIIGGDFSGGLLLVALALLAKVLATSFTLGTGGIGGVFAPALVAGSMAGLAYAKLLQIAAPSVGWASDSYYALLGMAGVLSAILKAPMTGVFLIVEITGGYSILVAVLLVATLSSWFSIYPEPHSLYRKELIELGSFAPPRTDARVLLGLRLSDLIERDCHVVRPDTTLRELVGILKHSHRNYFPVEDPKTGRFVGMVHLDDVREYVFEPSLFDVVVVADIMDSNVQTVSADERPVDIMQRFEQTGAWSLPVVQNGRFIGMISKSRILDHYRRELLAEEKQF